MAVQARTGGTILRYASCPAVRFNIMARLSPTSPALVGVSVLAGPIIMFCDVRQV
jgi:hypothetical protein